MKTFAKVLAGLVLVVLILAGSLYFLTFAGAQAPDQGPLNLDSRFERVMDAFCAIYLIDLGNGKLAMIDAGNDNSAKAILAALERKHKTPDDVVAIFITHSHSDHIAALPQFPKAAIYAGEHEVELAAGRQSYGSPLSKILFKTNQHPFTVTNPLKDGEQVKLGDATITAYALAGHTAGSTVYSVFGGVFLGDGANYHSDASLGGPWWIFSEDVEKGRDSLVRLATRLVEDKVNVNLLATAHTGATQGIEALSDFARKYKK